ncbi:MAG: 50S ribosomal protein L15 [Fibromonadaceae bacterium]|jgi:large subunit ribosomal protein L15|nr:50S ribosomal protein L15 [Fibromonadaceae bacterium]
MLTLNNINPGKSKVKGRKRIGRGPGSGWGTTAGRGQKGAGARKSAKAGRVAFEGGQMPIHRRLPKRGFKSKFPKDTQIVNLEKLDKATGTATFDAVVLFDLGFIRNVTKPIKILGTGKITRAIEIKVNAVSESAKKAIESVGGKIEIIAVE